VVTVKQVKRRVLPLVPSDEFANRVKPGMTYAELDEKLKEGVMADVEEKFKANTHKALTKALVATLPEEFEVPETLVDQITKEKFAMMLGDLREQGKPDEELKELVTPENYEAYKSVSRPMATASIKADFALKAVAMQQGLAVPEEQVEDELMTLQAQAVQRGEKFKPSQVRPKVQQQLEKNLILDWLAGFATITEVDAKDEADVSEILGATPEELAASMKKSGSPPAKEDR
jgi:FKBP-type peptidyl-prolyl cis-trans isomerase (trigger factor)